MSTLSDETQSEISRRLATGHYDSPDALIAEAFFALDRLTQEAEAWLEKELLKGLEGEDQEWTPADLDTIRREALTGIQERKVS